MALPTGKTIRIRDLRPTALIIGACGLSMDIILTAIGFMAADIEGGRTPLLDAWDLIKALALASALLFAARRARSRGLGLFALIFTAIGIADYSLAHDQIAEWLVGRVDFGGLGSLLPGQSAAWVELLILTLLALLVAVLIWIVKDPWEGYVSVRRTLIALLGLLVFFAIAVDLVAASSSSPETLTLIEESGERGALSLTLAYSAGIARAVAGLS